MATDIAFAVGVLTLLGNRVPSRLKMLLLTLAIVDDLGAILVIAVFYTASLNTTALIAAAGCLAGLIIFRQLGVWWMPAYVRRRRRPVGRHVRVGHPRHPRRRRLRLARSGHATASERDDRRRPSGRCSRRAEGDHLRHRETRSVVDRLIHALHPFTAFLIVPLFALANTGVPTPPAAVLDAATSSVGQAIFVGLVIGKPLGIVSASWLAVRLGIATLPKGVTWMHMIGIGFLGGIGFTVSLFITDLAFEDAGAVANAKIAILLASIVAAAAGAAFLKLGTKASPNSSESDLGPIDYSELDASTETVLPVGIGANADVRTNVI